MPVRYRYASGAIAGALMLAVTSVAVTRAGEAAPAADRLAAEKPFLAENDAAMAKMMAGMAPQPTGNIDVDFVHMMVPHHQGAVDMALLELRYGRNPILQRLAQEIIVEQQQEIVAMRRAIGETLPPSAAAPTAIPAHPHVAGTPMQMK